MSSKKEFRGKHILEVWDFRLSVANPLIRNDIGDTWLVQLWANENPDYDPEYPSTLAEPLETYDTGIPFEVGDHWDVKKIKKCYEWLYSVRDKYAREHIELRKPVAKLINESNAVASRIDLEKTEAQDDGNTALFHQKVGEMKTHLDTANAAIKKATEVFHTHVAELAEGGAQ